jgi:hypothetical protein
LNFSLITQPSAKPATFGATLKIFRYLIASNDFVSNETQKLTVKCFQNKKGLVAERYFNHRLLRG